MKKLIKHLEKYNRQDYKNIQKMSFFIDDVCEPLIVDFLTLLIEELQIIRKLYTNLDSDLKDKAIVMQELHNCQPHYLKHMAKIIECANITPQILPYLNDMTKYVEKWAKTIEQLDHLISEK
jgi:hypothetical protein